MNQGMSNTNDLCVGSIRAVLPRRERGLTGIERHAFVASPSEGRDPGDVGTGA